MSLQFGSQNNDDYIENDYIQSPEQFVDGAYVEQKASVPKPKLSIDYDMDMFHSIQRNSNELFESIVSSKKDEDYYQYINQIANEKKAKKEQKYVGFFSRLGEAFKHKGTILQRIGTNAIPDTLIEKSMLSDTYLKTLSVMETASENPDYATNILTSDSMINYLKGQADYLDNDLFELYRNSDYRYVINTSGITVGTGLMTWLSTGGAAATTALLAGEGIGAALAAFIAPEILIGAAVGAAAAGAISLAYWGYKHFFDKDPYDDKAIGYNVDAEGLLDEFGHEQGLRMVASKNLSKIADILERIKKLDTQDPYYKQTRNTLLNKVTLLAENIEETNTELSGESFGAIDNNSELVSILKENDFATTGLQEFANIKSNDVNKSKEIMS